jgi:hypothetical protein
MQEVRTLNQDMLRLMLDGTSHEESDHDVEGELFRCVSDFYNLPSVLESPDPAGAAARHLEQAEEIGGLMDIQFLRTLAERSDLGSFQGVTSILPLRGALGPASSDSIMTQLNKFGPGLHQILPLGIKRNGTDAHIYFPQESEAIDSSIRADRIYRIEDFGIATGGTMIDIVRQLRRNQVPFENIYIQGVVGTEYARRRIIEEFGGEFLPEHIIYAVEGRMPVEVNLMSQDPHRFYLGEIRPVGQDEEFQHVNPKDWGDQIFTPMQETQTIESFLNRLDIILTTNGQILGGEERQALMNHYLSLSKN